MFGHLDTNSDGSLSLQELYDLEHDQNEKCIKPFIDTCDIDQNTELSPREWCRCFAKADRPCKAVRRRLKDDLIGSYAPDCDETGFYNPTQCHNSVGICWCVDKHGVEFANTRTRNKPNCGKNFSLNDYLFSSNFSLSILSDDVVKNAATVIVTSDDEDDGDDVSEEGSANSLLVF